MWALACGTLQALGRKVSGRVRAYAAPWRLCSALHRRTALALVLSTRAYLSASADTRACAVACAFPCAASRGELCTASPAPPVCVAEARFAQVRVRRRGTAARVSLFGGRAEASRIAFPSQFGRYRVSLLRVRPQSSSRGSMPPQVPVRGTPASRAGRLRRRACVRVGLRAQAGGP